MAKKTVFISFDYDNDAYWKNLLLAWDKIVTSILAFMMAL
jgi:hypothetical protein